MSNRRTRFPFDLRGAQLDVGFKNSVLCDRIIAIQDVSSLPVRRMRDRALQMNMLVDSSAGRRERSIVVMDSGHLIVTSIGPLKLQERLKNATLQSALAHQELEDGEFVS